MSNVLRAPVDLRLVDIPSEQVRRSHHEKLLELQARPASALVVLPNIALAAGVATSIPHGLGRAPLWVKASDPRGATATGRIDEIRDGTSDRTKAIVLKATGYGATITVDVAAL